MTNVPAKTQFAACECGAPSIAIPADLVDDAPVACGGCDRIIGSWLGYKSFVSRSIALETHGCSNKPLVCLDPMVQPLEDALTDF
ncbi:hypothetical protein IP69_19745 [Bosea sp. AAP35]|uniref:hypothetical protein n=1 Tax=Bosea sp. AAP35 TaxID=1523417 RepID=UPI0006B921E8|nr:hypothetical protein [Bosea sp. AAP35]KPF62820.1 hypothetical protein IP69_19745 [Bosea sp. AAP35]